MNFQDILEKTLKLALRDKPDALCEELVKVPDWFEDFDESNPLDSLCGALTIILSKYKDVDFKEALSDLDFILRMETLVQSIIETYGFKHHPLKVDGFEFDVYVPEKNLVIEVTKLRESTAQFVPNNHFKMMNKVLASKGIKLLRFTDEELYHKTDLICSMIEHHLGVTKHRIPARKCEVRMISSKEAIKFANENHLNGGVNALENYALVYEGEVVQVMTFSKHRYANRTGKLKEETWEVIRACSKKFHLVQGGTQKLFKAFRKAHPDVALHTYCDMNISDGNSYAIGGKLISETEGDLWYVIPDFTSIVGCFRVIRNRMMKIYLHKYYEGFPKQGEPGYKEINSVEFLRQQGIFEYRGSGNLVFEIA